MEEMRSDNPRVGWLMYLVGMFIALFLGEAAPPLGLIGLIIVACAGVVGLRCRRVFSGKVLLAVSVSTLFLAAWGMTVFFYLEAHPSWHPPWWILF